MPPPKPLPPISIVQDKLSFDPKTGDFHWRPIENPQNADEKRYNSRYANKLAGTRSSGYITIYINGSQYKAHRLAWLLETGQDFPNLLIDHINGDRADNRIENLRVVDTEKNSHNQATPRSNTSGVLGVHWCERDARWVASITRSGTRIQLGTFESFRHAVIARKAAERALGYHDNHGRMARVYQAPEAAE